MKNITSIALILSLLSVMVLSGCTTANENTNTAKDCNYYCSQEGYGNAINASCVSFTTCNNPNTPISADICEGIDLCCCMG